MWLMVQGYIRLDPMFVNQVFYNFLNDDAGRKTEDGESKLLPEVGINSIVRTHWPTLLEVH